MLQAARATAPARIARDIESVETENIFILSRRLRSVDERKGKKARKLEPNECGFDRRREMGGYEDWRQSEGTVYTAEKGRREAGVQMRVWSEEGSLGGGAWSGCLVPNQAILSPWLF